MLPPAPPPRARSFRALRREALGLALALVLAAAVMPAQQMVTETKDPAQAQDEDFAKSVKDWTTQPYFISPLVDHLPKVNGVPSPKDVLGYHIGAPAKLTYYADILKYYRALAAAVPGRIKIETIGKSDEDRELVVVWISSDENIKNLAKNRDNLGRIADPRRSSPAEIRQLIATTRPQYHLMGGLHSGETGPSEMLMELAYRLATETSPLIKQIRDNVFVSITPVADPDGRDRNVDWFYRNRELGLSTPGAGGRGGAAPQATGGETTGDDSGGRRWRRWRPRWRAGRAVLGQVRLPRQQSRHQPVAGLDARHHRLVLHRAPADHARPARVAAAALHLQRRGAAESEPRSDSLRRAPLLLELRAVADDQVGHARRLYACLHGRLVSRLPRVRGLQPQRHDADVRDAGRQRHRRAARRRRPHRTAAAPGAGASPSTAPGAASPSDSAGRGQAANATAPEGGAGRGRRGRGGAGGGRQGAAAAEGDQGRGAGGNVAAGRGAAAAGPPTGRGGGQSREWYRGLPIPPGALANWSRRNNANYMQTGVLSGLQLTAMFPNLVVENFYQKTRNSIESGKTDAPFAFVIPVQRDGTRVAELVNILRAQGIEVGRATAEIKISDGTFPAGSYVIKRDQPYGRLAKNLLEVQSYPDPNLRTYDDSGWTMGLAMLADVREIKDKAILDTPTTLVEKATAEGKVTGNGSAGLAIAHYGSNNMVAFRYKLRNVPMKITDRATTIDGIDVPAGSFVVAPPADLAAVRSAVQQFGLTAVALSALPAVPMHDGDLPRVAIYSSWSGTQEIGWVRFTFDKFGVPFDLIYKERVRKGNLRADYDVIVMPTQTLTRQSVFQPAAARPVPYMKDAKYKFLGMYGESPDITGGMGGEGVDAFAKFLDAGGTLVAMGTAVRFPTDMGFARTVEAAGATSNNFYAPRPLVNAEVLRLDHPVFYGYTDKTMPIKYIQGQPLITVGEPDRGTVLARYVGGEAAVLSGLMRGADEIRERPVAVDVPGGYTGKGRVILFANNPIYRWQNHGEFNMVFNTLLNWNDLSDAARAKTAQETTSQAR